MRWLARLRWILARRPWIRWLMVAAAAMLVAWEMTAEVGSLHRARDRWGDTVAVLVATRELGPGDTLDGAVVRRSFPLELVPQAAVTSVGADTVVVQRVTPGEVIVERDIHVASGPLALLPPEWLAVAVPDDGAAGWVQPGDAATILADGRTAAAQAVVLIRTEGEVVVGVPAVDAAAVADAANRRVAVIAVSAGRP